MLVYYLSAMVLALAIDCSCAGCVYKDKTIKITKGDIEGSPWGACSISGLNDCTFAFLVASVNSDVFNVSGAVFPQKSGNTDWQDMFASTTFGPYGPDNFDHSTDNKIVEGSGGTYISITGLVRFGCIQPGSGNECQLVVKETNLCENNADCELDNHVNKTQTTIESLNKH